MLEKILATTLALNIVSSPLMVKLSDRVSFKRLYLCLLATTYVLPVIASSLIVNNVFLMYLSVMMYLVQILTVTLFNISYTMVSALFIASYASMLAIISLGFI